MSVVSPRANASAFVDDLIAALKSALTADGTPEPALAILGARPISALLSAEARWSASFRPIVVRPVCSAEEVFTGTDGHQCTEVSRIFPFSARSVNSWPPSKPGPVISTR